MSEKRKVLVTGGSRGIGKACAEAFVKMGHSVCFIYEKNEDAAKKTAASLGASAIKCDISKPDQVKRAVREAAELMGGIDVLVNNAAVSYIGLFGDMADGELQRLMDVNLTGAMIAAR